MTGAISPALSALMALGEKLGVTSNNIANANTNGFKKSRAVLEDVAPSGVTVSISRVETPGSPLPVDPETGRSAESSNVSLDEEAVSLLMTKNAYTANLKSIKAEEEMIGTLLDIMDE